MSTPSQLEGTLFVSETRLLHVGLLIATTRHAHHAAQIVIAPEGLYIEDGDKTDEFTPTPLSFPAAAAWTWRVSTCCAPVPGRRRRG